MRSGVVRLLKREDDAVLQEEHRGSAAEAVCTAVLLNGYIVIATDSGLISFFNPVTLTIVHTAQLPLQLQPKQLAAEQLAKPNQLQLMGADVLLVGMSDGSLLKLPMGLVPLGLPLNLASSSSSSVGPVTHNPAQSTTDDDEDSPARPSGAAPSDDEEDGPSSAGPSEAEAVLLGDSHAGSGWEDHRLRAGARRDKAETHFVMRVEG